MCTFRRPAIIALAFMIMGAGMASPPAAAPVSGATAVPPGTVTSVVDPGLLTHGHNVLHGIARDPNTGDLYIGVLNRLSHWAPFVGPSTSDDDSVRKITPSGTVSRLTSFPYPNAIIINPRDGFMYVASGVLRCADTSSGSLGGILSQTHCPGTHGIVVVNLSTGDHHDLAGAKAGFADGVGADARFSEPSGIAVDTDNGNLYVTDTGNHLVRQVTPNGTVSTFAGSGSAGNADGPGGSAMFNSPHGIVYCTRDKSLYIADTDNEEIRKVNASGVVSTVAGSPEAGYVDGASATARFDHPKGVACDAIGNVYVADTDNNVIRQIAPNGIVSTLAGSKDAGTVNAVGAAARFSNPTDLDYDPSDGSLYVIDMGSNNVRKVTAARI